MAVDRKRKANRVAVRAEAEATKKPKIGRRIKISQPQSEEWYIWTERSEGGVWRAVQVIGRPKTPREVAIYMPPLEWLRRDLHCRFADYDTLAPNFNPRVCPICSPVAEWNCGIEERSGMFLQKLRPLAFSSFVV